MLQYGTRRLYGDRQACGAIRHDMVTYVRIGAYIYVWARPPIKLLLPLPHLPLPCFLARPLLSHLLITPPTSFLSLPFFFAPLLFSLLLSIPFSFDPLLASSSLLYFSSFGFVLLGSYASPCRLLLRCRGPSIRGSGCWNFKLARHKVVG